MAITAYKTFSPGEQLTAADLNSSFSNIINNASDLVSPFTKNISAGGFKITSLADGVSGQDVVSYAQTLAALASTTSASGGAGMSGFSYAIDYALNKAGSVLHNLGIDVTQLGADKTGVLDCSSIVTSALATYPGLPLRFPSGTYRFDSTVNINGAPTWGVFGAGIIISGDGPGSTFLDNRVANGPLFSIDSDSHGGSYHANLGTVIQNLTILTTTSPASSTGVRVLNGYQVTFSNMAVKGMTQDGFLLANGSYSDDGWNRVIFNQVWIEACARWGIKADGSSGRNEGSYTHLTGVFFQTCGTNDSGAVPPTSGAMIWKGQVLTIDSSGAANGNHNVALYIKGDSGLANNVDIRGWTSENTVGRALYCTGVSMLKMRNCQMYQNNSFLGSTGIEFDGSAYTIRNVDIDGIVVRATSGNNPFTAFKISGANANLDNCRVKNVVWDNYDYTGQTRFNGWQFDAIPQQCVFEFIDTTTCRLHPKALGSSGNVMPLRLRGGIGGLASASGEWVPIQIPSTGISITNSGLSNSTQYYAYLYDNTGVSALAWSTVAPQIDTSTGYLVNSGTFATTVLVGQALCVGAIQTTGAGAFNSAPGAINYSASMTPDASLALFPGVSNGQFTISPSNGTAFTINDPINPTWGQIASLTMRNVSGGVLGAVTWGSSYKMSAWTSPANGYSRSITFRYAQGVWLQIGATGVDVPN